MRYVFSVLLLMVMVLSSCDHSTNHGNPSYITCYADETNNIFVDITLPYEYTGIFTETTVLSFGELVPETATYNLGIFEPGEYVFELELVRIGPPPSGAFVQNLDGFVDVCSITIFELPPVEPPPVNPPVIDPPLVPPPVWGLHKILVCRDGEQKFLPYPAASNLIGQGKATLGTCSSGIGD